MKAKVKIPLIIVASVVAAVVIAVIVLCSVTVRPFKPYANYETAKIITSDTTSQVSDITDSTPETKAKLDNGIKKSSFSVMHAMLEFVGSYSAKFEKIDDPDSTDKKPPQIKNEITVDVMKTRTTAGESQYVLELWYKGEQTVKVEKEVVKFDRLRMNVVTTSAQIHRITVYPYLQDMTSGEGNPDVMDYRITPIVLRLNTTTLYNAIGEIIEMN